MAKFVYVPEGNLFVHAFALRLGTQPRKEPAHPDDTVKNCVMHKADDYRLLQTCPCGTFYVQWGGPRVGNDDEHW